MSHDQTAENPPFAALIVECRRRLGFSQRQLGAELRTSRRPHGVWNTYIGEIEKGEKVPSDEVVLKMAEVLGLDGGTALLAAYRARTESAEVADLLGRVKQDLERQSPGSLTAQNVETWRGDRHWRQAVTDALESSSSDALASLLDLAVRFREEHWQALYQAMGTMDEWRQGSAPDGE